jgi:2-dehydro-3-deoxyphosphooctonate aldolase (KDO 8-P synthase)
VCQSDRRTPYLKGTSAGYIFGEPVWEETPRPPGHPRSGSGRVRAYGFTEYVRPEDLGAGLARPYHTAMGKLATPCVSSNSLRIGGDTPLLLIAGPCVIESEDALRAAAEGLLEQTRGLPLTVVFKASYDKANRSSADSFRGPGLAAGLPLLARVREQFGLPITSDVHTPQEAAAARDVLDIVQIPALLCRQNDLVREAAATGRIVNIKKGQFLSPGEMPNRARAARGPDGTSRVIATERGTFFGYNTLVNDFKGIVQMRRAGLPTIFDATHSVQRPASEGTTTGGDREFVPALARAAAAVGVDGFFFEIHPDPDCARCDGPNSVALAGFRNLLEELIEIDRVIG